MGTLKVDHSSLRPRVIPFVPPPPTFHHHRLPEVSPHKVGHTDWSLCGFFRAMCAQYVTVRFFTSPPAPQINTGKVRSWRQVIMVAWLRCAAFQAPWERIKRSSLILGPILSNNRQVKLDADGQTIKDLSLRYSDPVCQHRRPIRALCVTTCHHVWVTWPPGRWNESDQTGSDRSKRFNQSAS